MHVFKSLHQLPALVAALGPWKDVYVSQMCLNSLDLASEKPDLQWDFW